jgi:hypothetical protein
MGCEVCRIKERCGYGVFYAKFNCIEDIRESNDTISMEDAIPAG